MPNKKLFLNVLLTTLIFISCKEEPEEIRIVSLSTTHSEIIIELGGGEYLEAVDMFINTSKHKDIKRLDAFNIDAIQIINLNPTHVFIAFPNEELKEELKKNFIQTILLPPAENLNQVYEQINLISEILNKENRGKEIINSMKKEANYVYSNAREGKRRIYHEVGYAYGLYAAGENSLVGSFYRELGFINIANKTHSGEDGGYPRVEEKLVIANNPEIIIIAHQESLTTGVKNRPNWGNIKAVENENIIYLDEGLAKNWGVSSTKLLKQIAIDTGVLGVESENKDVDLNIRVYKALVAILLFIGLKMTKNKEKT